MESSSLGMGGGGGTVFVLYSILLNPLPPTQTITRAISNFNVLLGPWSDFGPVARQRGNKAAAGNRNGTGRWRGAFTRTVRLVHKKSILTV